MLVMAARWPLSVNTSNLRANTTPSPSCEAHLRPHPYPKAEAHTHLPPRPTHCGMRRSISETTPAARPIASPAQYRTSLCVHACVRAPVCEHARRRLRSRARADRSVWSRRCHKSICTSAQLRDAGAAPTAQRKTAVHSCVGAQRAHVRVCWFWCACVRVCVRVIVREQAWERECA